MRSREIHRILAWLALVGVIASATKFAIACFPDGVPTLARNGTRPPRIVSLVAGVTDTLLALGAADDIVNASNRKPAVDGPQAGKPRLYASERSGMTNAEGILSLDPDYVFVARELVPCLRDRGLNVVMVPQDTFSDIGRFVLEVGRVVDNERGANALLDRMNAKIESIRNRVAHLPRVRVYYEDGQPGRTRGPGTAAHEMLELAGGVNIYQDASVPRPTISIEMILAGDPEVIIVPSTVTPDQVRARPGWDVLSAVRNGRIHSIPESERSVSLYSPNCADCCERTFLRWIHPELGTGEETR